MHIPFVCSEFVTAIPFPAILRIAVLIILAAAPGRGIRDDLARFFSDRFLNSTRTNDICHDVSVMDGTGLLIPNTRVCNYRAGKDGSRKQRRPMRPRNRR